MALLTVTTISPSGTVAPTPVAAAGGGDTFPNNGKVQLDITNGGGGSITVTVVAVLPCDQQSLHNITNAIAAGATERMGPFDRHYIDSSGITSLTYSGVTSVTIAPFAPS